MTSFTPGPWHVGYRGMDIGCTNAKIGGHAKLFDIRGWGYLTGNGHGGLGLSEQEAIAIQEANARLVAAAPEMLEALDLVTGCLLWNKQDEASQEVMRRVNAVRAKAEGRS